MGADNTGTDEDLAAEVAAVPFEEIPDRPGDEPRRDTIAGAVP